MSYLDRNKEVIKRTYGPSNSLGKDSCNWLKCTFKIPGDLLIRNVHNFLFEVEDILKPLVSERCASYQTQIFILQRPSVKAA